MPELKDLVQFALDKQPSKFKETFAELLSQRVVANVDDLKSEIQANMFGEAPEDVDDEEIDDFDTGEDEDEDDNYSDEEIEDLSDITDDELEELINFDDEDEDVDDDSVSFDDEDEDSFNEESPAIKEGLRNVLKKVGAKIKQGMADDLDRADDARAAKARDKENKAILKAHYRTSNINTIHKMRAHSIKSGRGDF